MKTTLRVATITLLFLTSLPFAGQLTADDLAGDENAVKLAERMLETLGGRQVWAEARTIKVELLGYYAREPEPWNETFWMDLEAPNGRFELRGGDVDRTIAWTPDGGWEVASGELEQMEAERHAFELQYWKRQSVVIFHRLAKGGAGTRVAMGDNEYRFDVFDTENDELLAQFAVNLKGEPTKWGSKIGEREFEQILGPLADFGNLRLFKWGATLSGVWRYEHSSISLSSAPVPASLNPPTTQDESGTK